MSPGIQLIVGLANPGAEYEHTRHNAGAWFVTALAEEARANLRFEKKYQGFHAITHLANHECHLLIPTTYMNLSGQSVQALANYYKIPSTTMLVAHDEIDLPVSIIRLKYDGGHGGHNGLRDIISHLNTTQFHRLRIGVGHPGVGQDVAHYVLNPPAKKEREEIDSAIKNAEDIIPLVLQGDFQKAMRQLHKTE